MIEAIRNWWRGGKGRRSIHNPAVPLSGSAILDYLGAGLRTPSGETVSVTRALTYSPVWQAVDVISSDVSRIPFLVYAREGENRRRATEHPAYRLIRRHTGEMTANLWLARSVAQALLYGNSYSRIRRRLGEPARLELLHPDQVRPDRLGGKLAYVVQYRAEVDRPGPTMERVPATDVFHLVGLTIEDLGGLSIVDYARNTIGRQLAAEGYGDDFFSNLAFPAGFFEHPGEMSPEAKERFLAAVQNRHQGAGQRFRSAILEEGMKWSTTTVAPEDALLIDQLKWGVKDVARFFSIPPHRLGDDSKAAFNSLESENMAYFMTTLGKWVSRLEFEGNEKLLTEAEKADDSRFCEFLQDAIYKADTATRYAAYAVAVQWGWMNRNEVRARENLNPYPGGDAFLTPLNMSGSGDGSVDETLPADPADGEAAEPARAVDPLQLRTQLRFAGRMLVNRARREAASGQRFWHWLEVYGEEYEPKIRRIIGDVGLPDGEREALVDRFLDRATDRFLRASECPEAELVDQVRESLAELYQVADELSEGVLA